MKQKDLITQQECDEYLDTLGESERRDLEES